MYKTANRANFVYSGNIVLEHDLTAVQTPPTYLHEAQYQTGVKFVQQEKSAHFLH